MEARDLDKRSTELIAQFGPWTDPTSNEHPPMVLVGAGLSYGLAPPANDLAKEIGSRRSAIEKQLGVATNSQQIQCADELYCWAEKCLELKIRTGVSEAEAKTSLAEAMGLTADARFLARENIPLRGTTARHRVLSRLAREGRVNALWSFNWDCWLEMSLESVGLRAGERTGGMLSPLEWKLRYLVWVDSMTGPAKSDSIPLFKAHGCLRALAEGRGDFVISKGEMERDLSQQPAGRVDLMKAQVGGRWMVALGWSASERYVRQLLLEQGGKGLLGDRLTIVDVDPTRPHHQDVCASYKCDLDASGRIVSGRSPGSTDDLFLWIQTHRGLAAIREGLTANEPLHRRISELEALVPVFDDPNFHDFWCVSLLDSWLPVWLKTCFMTSAQDYRVKPGKEAEILPSDQRDAHIPWGTDFYSRKDLQAAASLIASLASDAQNLGWDFDTFPGALWDKSRQMLVVPIPVWADPERVAGVRLKPIIESSHWLDKSRIRRMMLLPLQPETALLGDPEVAARTARWSEAIAPLFGQAHLAAPGGITSVNLVDLAAMMRRSS
ncbi:hypothetical protein [Stenotrophomonas sp.]|uniref:hypothetical protein n=1 Tax=Stenotrophomonas sp. TaxID=69392 RepID=UPI0028B0E911|nr:hypothetical protein [Stenotrophomonas sp.]